jgi:mannose-6-phosphate isomerase-like protein (cupin superfamily)
MTQNVTVNEYRPGQRDDRPWGDWTVLDAGPGYVVKRLRVLPGGRLSLQRHRHRAERWVVATGTPTVTVDTERRILTPGDAVIIPIRAVHRLENEGAADAVVIEVGLGDQLREDDIERLEDVYGRAEARGRHLN